MQGFRSHVSGESGIRIRNVLNPLSSVEICEYAMNSESCVDTKSEFNIVSSGDVTRSSPVLYREYCIQDGNLVARFSLLPVEEWTLACSLQICHNSTCRFDALYDACLAFLAIFPEQSWVLEWIRMRVGCSPKRANLIWIRIFSLRISKVFGFKNIMRFLFPLSVVRDNVKDTRSRVFAIIFSIVEWWKVIRRMM